MVQVWQDQWQLHPSTPNRSGGQATVQHVVSLDGQQHGALKVLLPDREMHSERRFRMRLEASALEALTSGVPKLLDTNALDADENVPLFIVMEWIEGPTLSQRVAKGKLSLDESLTCIRTVLNTLEAMHALPMVHRDLKPDNVMLRDGSIADAVVIDLGLAWAHDRPPGAADFRTERGREIGNRFLRLPEFAPGHSSQDHRSDIALAAGLLFYMITGASPRVLMDERSSPPHEALAEEIPIAVSGDARWPRLSRAFTRAFQTSLALRFQSASEMSEALDNLDPMSLAADPLSPALERLKARMESQNWRQTQEVRRAINELGGQFDNHLRHLLRQSGLSLPGSHGFDSRAQAYETTIGLQIPYVSGGTVCCIRHRVLLDGAHITALYEVQPGRTASKYYEGSVVDISGLKEAMWAKAPTIVAEAIGTFERLSD